MSVGIANRENEDGARLLATACDEMIQKMNPYFHRWSDNDVVVFDNWRMLHSVSGHDPKYGRVIHRTTIRGDYGLGSFEEC